MSDAPRFFSASPPFFEIPPPPPPSSSEEEQVQNPPPPPLTTSSSDGVDRMLFPNEVMDILNTDFMGFKLWHLLIVALIVPSPWMFILLFLLIPGFKEKATGVIKNGISGVYSGIPSLT